MIRGGRLLLLDTVERKNIDLSARGADTRADAANYLPHRAVAFDAEGGRLLYLRRDPDRLRAVVLDLRNGLESLIDAGSGAVWRAELPPHGGRAVRHAGGHQPQWAPGVSGPRKQSGLRGAAADPYRVSTPGRAAETLIEPRVALSGATDAIPVPGFVAMLGSDFVVRDPSDGWYCSAGHRSRRWLPSPSSLRRNAAPESCTVTRLAACCSSRAPRRRVALRSSSSERVTGAI